MYKMFLTVNIIIAKFCQPVDKIHGTSFNYSVLLNLLNKFDTCGDPLQCTSPSFVMEPHSMGR